MKNFRENFYKFPQNFFILKKIWMKNFEENFKEKLQRKFLWHILKKI